MADVLTVFEMYLKKIGGELVDLRINYDKLSSCIETSLGEAKLWQIVHQFVETLKVMLNERTKLMKTNADDTSDDTWSVKTENQSGSGDKMPTNNEKDDRPNKNKSFADPSLVQITASKAEIDRRIAAFLKKKQLDVDIHNQREFCNLLNTENEYSCARVDAVFLPRVGQKSHISVIDADRENEIMKSDNITVDTMLYSLPSKRQKTSGATDDLPYGVQERLDNIETHLKLNVKSIEHDVYSRLKRLEEKILYLEGLSPEYFNFKCGSGYIPSRRLSTNRQTRSTDLPISGSSNDLDERMLKLKEKLLSEKLTRKKES